MCVLEKAEKKNDIKVISATLVEPIQRTETQRARAD